MRRPPEACCLIEARQSLWKDGQPDGMTQLNEDIREPLHVLVVAAGSGASQVNRLLGDVRDGGVVAHMAGTLADGLRARATQRCDAILLPLDVPGVSLEDALRRVRESAPGVPVVTFTEVDGRDGGDVSRCFGVFDHIVVGDVNPRMLVQALRHAVERAGLESRLEELERQRGFFRSLFENSPEGIVSFDANGRVVDVNPAFERLFGFKRESIVGQDIVAVIVPSRLEASGRQVLRDSLDGATVVRETVRKRAGGAEVPVSILGAPVVLDGMRVGGFGIYRDESAQHEAQERLQEAFIDLVETIARAIESVDPYTALHQRRVARLADIVGRRLGLDDDRLQGLYVGSMLHDIGKLSLPSTILTKPGKLTREEWNLVRSHSRRGFDILAEANLPWPVADMALKHHERLDGSGYPDGVSGDDLSLELRILGVCDVVEAMTSDRPYRPALPVEAVLKDLSEGSGTRYDESVVEAVMEVVESGEFLLNSGFRNEFA